MPSELLEFVIRLVGGQAAAAKVNEVAGAFDKLTVSEERAGVAGETAGKNQAAGAAAMGASFKKFGMYGAGALVAVGLESVHMANKFDTEMLKIRTEGGATTKEFHRMRIAVNDMAKSGASMGTGPVELAKGLYHLESMGLRGSLALKALKLASQEAAISGSNLEGTTTAIGGALYVAMKGTGGLSHVMGVLNGIAGAGNMRFQQLNEALGTGLLSSAKLAGLSIQETGAALGVLTDAGTPASSAAATLATALHFLYAPTAKAQGALKDIGLNGAKLSADLQKPQGLSSALGDLRKHLQGLSTARRQDILNSILPGGRGRVLLQLLSMLDRLPPKFRQISAASHSSDFGRHVMEQAGNAATKTQMRVAKFQAGMVDLGHALGPLVNGLKNFALGAGTVIVGALVKAVQWLTTMTNTVMKFRSTINVGGFWDGLMAGMANVVLFIVNKFNDLISAYNNTLGQLPGAPTIGLIGTTSLQTAANGGAVTAPAHVGATSGQTISQFRNSGAGAPASSPSSPVIRGGHSPGGVTTHAATGDIHIYVGGQKFAHVTRREIQKAMMAGS